MSDTQTCPACAEEIKAAAVRCKHCGKKIPKAVTAETGAYAVFGGLAIIAVAIFVLFKYGDCIQACAGC